MEIRAENTTVRKARLEDARRVWELRNDPVARKWSKSDAEIPFDQKWFEQKYFVGKKNQCFVLQCGGKVYGYCRLDLKDEKEVFEISIAIDSSLRSRGLGTKLLGDTLKKFASRPIAASIKKGNKASQRLFQKFGFEIERQDGKFYFLSLASASVKE